MLADPSTIRVCSCGARFSSSHATSCLKCMFIGVEKIPRTEISVTSEEKPHSNIASTDVHTKSKKKKKQRGSHKPTVNAEAITVQHSRLPLSSSTIPRGIIVCVLCGEFVSKGKLLKHKHERHGEMQIAPSPSHDRKVDWITIFQGGLPGLGKNSR